MAFRSNKLALGPPGHPERPVRPSVQLATCLGPAAGGPDLCPFAGTALTPALSGLFHPSDCSGASCPRVAPGRSIPERAPSHWAEAQQLARSGWAGTPRRAQTSHYGALEAGCPGPRHPQSCVLKPGPSQHPVLGALGSWLIHPALPVVFPGPPQASLTAPPEASPAPGLRLSDCHRPALPE